METDMEIDMTLTGQWDATAFFKYLADNNKLAKSYNFRFCEVSGLEGFEEALQIMQQTSSFICISDASDGYTQLNNSPHSRRVKTVFLAMRHPAEDMKLRRECLVILRELFRQLLSVLIRERVKLAENCIYLDPKISFSEIDRYFAAGCACACFQIAVDCFTDLRFRDDEWLNLTDNPNG